MVLVLFGVAASKHTSYTTLQPGACINTISSSSVFNSLVDKVDCSKAHEIEVTGRFGAADPGTYPGETGFQSEGQTKCETLTTDYLGQAPGDFRFIFLFPDKSSWDSGTRTIVCGIGNTDKSKHTGSFKP